jgi:hypothetical protein
MDVLATVSVNSFVTDAARVRRIHRGLAAACDGLLAGIPRDAHLLDTDVAAVEGLLAAACEVPGVLVPVATKVLHRKRPHLIPMLDNVMLAHYFVSLGRPERVGRSQNKRRAALVARIALEAFRTDLKEADRVLVDVAEQLAIKRGAGDSREAARAAGLVRSGTCSLLPPASTVGLLADRGLSVEAGSRHSRRQGRPSPARWQ